MIHSCFRALKELLLPGFIDVTLTGHLVGGALRRILPQIIHTETPEALLLVGATDWAFQQDSMHFLHFGASNLISVIHYRSWKLLWH